MGVSADAGRNINSMFGQLFLEDDIIKLIYNLSPNALNDPRPSVSLSQLLVDRKLCPLPKIPETEEAKDTFICIYLEEIDMAGRNNVYQNNANIIVDVITHIDAWMLNDGKIRIYELLDLVDNKLVNMDVDGIRGDLVAIQPARFIAYNKRFFGYRSKYQFTNSSNKLCGRG